MESNFKIVGVLGVMISIISIYTILKHKVCSKGIIDMYIGRIYIELSEIKRGIKIGERGLMGYISLFISVFLGGLMILIINILFKGKKVEIIIGNGKFSLILVIFGISIIKTWMKGRTIEYMISDFLINTVFIFFLEEMIARIGLKLMEEKILIKESILIGIILVYGVISILINKIGGWENIEKYLGVLMTLVFNIYIWKIGNIIEYEIGKEYMKYTLEIVTCMLLLGIGMIRVGYFWNKYKERGEIIKFWRLMWEVFIVLLIINKILDELLVAYV